MQEKQLCQSNHNSLVVEIILCHFFDFFLVKFHIHFKYLLNKNKNGLTQNKNSKNDF